jgi:predicted CXXCH cytochrome family protein
VTTQMAAIEPSLFKQRCEYCHTLKREGDALPQVVSPAIPSRWLPHARFDHSAHRPLACAECHKAAASSETKDVLMPSIATCRECHQPRDGARTGCVECHRYHDKAQERSQDGPFKVRQLLDGIGSRRPDRVR